MTSLGTRPLLMPSCPRSSILDLLTLPRVPTGSSEPRTSSAVGNPGWLVGHLRSKPSAVLARSTGTHGQQRGSVRVTEGEGFTEAREDPGVSTCLSRIGSLPAPAPCI